MPHENGHECEGCGDVREEFPCPCPGGMDYHISYSENTDHGSPCSGTLQYDWGSEGHHCSLCGYYDGYK